MNTNQIAKEIITEKVEEKLNQYPLLMNKDDVMPFLGLSTSQQLYNILNSHGIPGAQKIPGIGWRFNRDVFFTWLYSGEAESKPFKPVRRVK